MPAKERRGTGLQGIIKDGGSVKRSRIDCHKCKYYYVTWEKNFPHGCKAMGFKSKQFPAITVYVSSNQDCLLYREKKSRNILKKAK
jgi:hypothetical protein